MATVDRSCRLRRLTLAGPELVGFSVHEPAASVRVLIPSPGSDELVMPWWNGNEFLLPDGSRPVIRTLTPLRADADRGELDIEVVLHGDGPLARWAERAAVGAVAAVSGPGRGFVIDGGLRRFVLAGDESALPAIGQLLEALPTSAEVIVHVEIDDPCARIDLPSRPRTVIEWHVRADGAPPGDALLASLAATELGSDTHVWVAGEAAAVQRIRKLLFEERGIPRSQATVRGYWKSGRDHSGSVV